MKRYENIGPTELDRKIVREYSSTAAASMIGFSDMYKVTTDEIVD